MNDETPRARTMALQSVANKIVRGLLCTPLICRGIGSRLITIYVVGRKSGKRFSIPVAYTREGDTLLVGTPFAWGRNLRTGEPVSIRLKGKRRKAAVETFTEEADVIRLYAAMCRDNRQFAKFNKVGIEADGTPNADDLHLAWASGARAFRLQPL